MDVMKNAVRILLAVAFVGGVFTLLASCAAERQTVVCEEIEYRLNTMTYSPDQRAFEENELQVCREEEAKKKGEAAAMRKSIYDRFAASDSTKKSSTDKKSDSSTPGKDDLSVSELMKDSSGEKTTSIYDRYGAMGGDTSKTVATVKDSAVAVDSSAKSVVDTVSTAKSADTSSVAPADSSAAIVK